MCLLKLGLLLSVCNNLANVWFATPCKEVIPPPMLQVLTWLMLYGPDLESALPLYEYMAWQREKAYSTRYGESGASTWMFPLLPLAR